MTRFSEINSLGPQKPMKKRDRGKFNILENMNTIVKPVLTKMIQNNHGNRTFIAVRDFPLSRFMPDEIRLKSAGMVV